MTAKRTVTYQQLVDAVRDLFLRIAFQLPADVLAALQRAWQTERHAGAKQILAQLLDNARIASEKQLAICQDTGLAVVFVRQGVNCCFLPPPDKSDATPVDAVNAGVAAAYEEGYLRKSVVAEPLHQWHNTKTNTPAIVHCEWTAGDRLELWAMAKGGGCENKSQFKMFNPTAGVDEVCDWIVTVVKDAGPNACPPLVVGVGLGGNFELACLLAKKALLRPIGFQHPDPFYADLERRLLAAVNATGLGPQGLGGDTTALAVHIETAPCHIASLPAAVNIECHAHRHGHIVL